MPYTAQEEAFFRTCGGLPQRSRTGLYNAGPDEWNFGLLPRGDRFVVEEEAHGDALSRIEPFRLSTHSLKFDRKRIGLWEASKIVTGGPHFMVFYQQTGSCVGNGLGQATWYTSAVEVALKGDPEECVLPFWLLAYGKSREYCGSRGRGEGSMGSTAAKAAMHDGFIPYNLAGLPQPTDAPGLTWGRQAELEWSDGAAIPPKWLELSRVHLIQSAAQCKSTDDVRTAIQNGYACTCASNWGGRMQCPTEGGSNPVLLNERQGTWNHQMSCIGWQEHPTLGELYYILNSWSPKAHGTPPDDAPPGGFWIRKGDMEYIVRQEEVFALSSFQGFPARELNWFV